jgi:hypothetical protein
MDESTVPITTRSPQFLALCDALTQMDLEYYVHPTKPNVLIGIRMTNVNPILAISFKEGRPVLRLRFHVPLVVPEERRVAVGQFLHALNFRIDFGTFRLDPHDGELQFFIGHDFTGATEFPAEMLSRMMLISQATIDGFFPALARVIFAGMNPDQALEQGEAHYFQLRGLNSEGENPDSSDE